VGYGIIEHPNKGYRVLMKKRCNKYVKLSLNHRAAIVMSAKAI